MYRTFLFVYRNSVEGFMFFTYYGVNTVYILLVASSFEKVIFNYYSFDLHYLIIVV